MNVRVAATTGLVLSVLLFPSRATGQAEPGDPQSRAGRQEPRQERLIDAFVDRATAELNLTGAEREQLENVLRETLERRARLARRQQELRHEIQGALSDPNSEDGEFRRLTDLVLEVKRDEMELAAWQRDSLLEFLTPRQTLRFMLMQQQLAQRVDEVRRKRQP